MAQHIVLFQLTIRRGKYVLSLTWRRHGKPERRLQIFLHKRVREVLGPALRLSSSAWSGGKAQTAGLRACIQILLLCFMAGGLGHVV